MQASRETGLWKRGVLWLLLLGLIRPLEWLHARARRQPLTAAPLSEALRSRFGDWILRLF